MADAGVVFQSVHGHVLAIARLFHAAVGHFADEHEVRVYPSAAILQARGEAIGAPHILCPDRRRQAVIRVVGERQGLGFVRKRGDRHHRAKDFALDDFIVLAGVCQHRGLKEKAWPFDAVAAGDDADVRQSLGPLDKAYDPFQVVAGNQRAEFGVGIVL